APSLCRPQMADYLSLQRNHVRGGLFPGFDAGLVIGVDVDERRVKPNRPLEERDEQADAERAHFAESEGDALPALLVKRLPRAEQETAEKVAAGDALLNLNASPGAVLQHLDEQREEIQHPFAQLLHVSVLVGRTLVAVDSQPLVHRFAIEIELLAERL